MRGQKLKGRLNFYMLNFPKSTRALVINITIIFLINSSIIVTAQVPFVRVLRHNAVSPHPNLNRNRLHFISDKQTFISKSTTHLGMLANVNSPTSFPFFLSKGLFISGFFRATTPQQFYIIYFVSLARNIMSIKTSQIPDFAML